MNFLKVLLTCCTIFLLMHCTPKVVEQTASTEPEQPTSTTPPPKPEYLLKKMNNVWEEYERNEIDRSHLKETKIYLR